MGDPLKSADVVARAAGAEGVAVGSDFVVLDGNGAVLRGLNRTGAALWQRADGRRSLRELAHELAVSHDVEEGRVLQDVMTFASALRDLGLLRLCHPTPVPQRR